MSVCKNVNSISQKSAWDKLFFWRWREAKVHLHENSTVEGYNGEFQF